MFEAATKFAQLQAAALRQSALTSMNQMLDHEVRRLQMLRGVNDHIRPQEIQLAQAQQQELATTLQQSRLRLDAVRLIWKGPPEALK
jgi:ATP-dependent helicase HepA